MQNFKTFCPYFKHCGIFSPAFIKLKNKCLKLRTKSCSKLVRGLLLLWLRSEGLDDVTNDVPAHRAEPAAAAFPLLQGALVAHAHVATGVQDAVDAYKATKERKKVINWKSWKIAGESECFI